MNPYLALGFFGFLIIGAVATFIVLANHAQMMYQEFNRQYLAAQILEAELQHKYNDANLTIKIYEPPKGMIPL